MAKKKQEVVTVDQTFADMLGASQKKFGKAGTYVAADHEAAVPILPCPTAWGYFVGGVNGVPLSRILGTDGKSGYFKTFMAWEHIRWFLEADGVAVAIDNEERTDPAYIRSILASLPYEQRRRLIFHETSSIDAWKSRVTFWLQQAQTLADVPPEARVPMVVAIDSLTGRGTQKDQKDMATEQSSGYGTDAAKAISQFYQNTTFKGALISLLHIQHSYRSMDPNAKGDDEWVAKGGDRPRYAATYHWRPTSVSDFSFADYQGKQVYLKCIKSSLGPNKRKLCIRICWRFEWQDLPVFKVEPALSDDEDPTYELEGWQEQKVDAETAFQWWESVNPHIPLTLADQILEQMGLTSANPPTEVSLPITDRQKVQFSWVDWDWALAWLLIDNYKYGTTPAADKHDLDEILSFTNSGCNKDFIKSEQLFGDKEPRRYTEFGKAISADPDLLHKVENFLGIKRYPHFRQVRSGLNTKPEKEKKATKK